MYDEAIRLAGRYAEAIVARHPEHPGLADALYDLALRLRYANLNAEAEPVVRNALAICERTLGSEHADLSAGLRLLDHILVSLQWSHGIYRLGEREALHRRALAIDEKALGPEHPDLADRLRDLALLLGEIDRRVGDEDSDRVAEEEALRRRALTIDEKALGSEHYNVGLGFYDLALWLGGHRPAEAELLIRRAIAIYEKTQGPESPCVADGLDQLISLLRMTGRLAEAESPMRRALAIDEKTFGPEHPHVVKARASLAELLLAINSLRCRP